MRIVIVHGTEGSPQSDWLPWLAEQVKATGHEVIVPAFPTPEGQNLDSWKETFARKVGALESDMALVGFSIGVGFSLRLLEESNQPVAGSFLAAGFTTRLNNDFFDPLIESFFQAPFDWERIRKNAGKAFVYHGTNDPYVPASHADEIARELGVKPILIPNGGHLSEGSGFTELPRLWNDLKPMLESS